MSDVLTAVEVNCETGEVITRPLTDEEITAQQELAAKAAEDAAAREAEAAAVAVAKEAAHAKLAALGLTAEEIAAIAGKN